MFSYTTSLLKDDSIDKTFTLFASNLYKENELLKNKANCLRIKLDAMEKKLEPSKVGLSYLTHNREYWNTSLSVCLSVVCRRRCRRE